MEFQNLATSLGVDLGGWSWGAQFGDVNNDGFVDLYLTNGYISLSCLPYALSNAWRMSWACTASSLFSTSRTPFVR